MDKNRYRTRTLSVPWLFAMRAHNTAYAVLSLTHNGRNPDKKTAMFPDLAMTVWTRVLWTTSWIGTWLVSLMQVTLWNLREDPQDPRGFDLRGPWTHCWTEHQIEIVDNRCQRETLSLTSCGTQGIIGEKRGRGREVKVGIIKTWFHLNIHQAYRSYFFL